MEECNSSEHKFRKENLQPLTSKQTMKAIFNIKGSFHNKKQQQKAQESQNSQNAGYTHQELELNLLQHRKENFMKMKCVRFYHNFVRTKTPKQQAAIVRIALCSPILAELEKTTSYFFVILGYRSPHFRTGRAPCSSSPSNS